MSGSFISARVATAVIAVTLITAACAGGAPATVAESGAASRSVGEGVLSSDATEEDGPAPVVATAPPVNPVVEVDEALAETVTAEEVPDFGESSWAVVVAGASDPFDPLLAEAVQDLAAEGYETTITNCDVGAADALRMQPGESYTVSVYAADEAAAVALSADLEQRGFGGPVAQVLVECP